MADNVTIPLTGSGDATAVVATDEVGGAQHQYVKLEFGADGTATKVSSSDPLPVTFALGASAAHQVTGNASLSSILVSLGDILTELSQKMEAGDAVTVSSGTVTANPATSSSANNAGGQVALSTSAATLLASFASRKGIFIIADVDMFVKFGSGATTSNFKFEAGQPLSLAGGVYTGIITAILASGTGTAYVMEW